MPCAAIHERSCGIVRRTTVHRIHLPARPLMWKLIPPSCRRLTPAAARVQNAAGTARSNSSCNRSRRNCGTGIRLSFLNALRLSDKALGHAPKAGDHHQSNAGDSPAHVAASALEVPACDAKAGHCDDRSDDVAAPVDDIEDGALDRGRLLADRKSTRL